MLNERDNDKLEEAFNWARKKARQDEERTFVFSSEDSAREATDILVGGRVDATNVAGPAVEVTRPGDPELQKHMEENIEALSALNRQNR